MSLAELHRPANCFVHNHEYWYYVKDFFKGFTLLQEIIGYVVKICIIILKLFYCRY